MLKRLICAVIGHQYRVLRRMNPGARKVGCDRCGCTWGMHDATRSFVPWDGELEALYAPDGMLAQTLRNPPSNAKVSGAGTASAGLPGWQANSKTE